jgi:hypothetical protein
MEDPSGIAHLLTRLATSIATLSRIDGGTLHFTRIRMIREPEARPTVHLRLFMSVTRKRSNASSSVEHERESVTFLLRFSHVHRCWRQEFRMLSDAALIVIRASLNPAK